MLFRSVSQSRYPPAIVGNIKVVVEDINVTALSHNNANCCSRRFCACTNLIAFNDGSLTTVHTNTTALGRRIIWFDGLDEVRKKVLVDMAFNMGMKTLKTFKNTLKMVANGDYDGASKGMLQSKWAKQVGKRAERLAHMMRTGKDYDSDGGLSGC